MGFVKNIKSKFEEHFIPDERDYDENDVEYEDEEDGYEYSDGADDYYDEEESSPFAYSSDDTINPPEYVKYGETASKSKKVERPVNEYKSVKQQPKSNIYNMGSAKTQGKFKLNFIALHDIYDAKNVANIMIDQNAMVVVNLGLLSDEQKRRAMDFLDGAKYVTNSIFTRFTENICAFLPESVELHGDFYGQVDLDDFGNF